MPVPDQPAEPRFDVEQGSGEPALLVIRVLPVVHTAAPLLGLGVHRPRHKGWWSRAQAADNVLFVRFEDMKEDLSAIVRQVADFLGMTPLTDDEVAEVVRKTSFGYMQQHKGHFEMNPPHILQTDAELFVRGTADRHKDVPADVRARIAEWCATELGGSGAVAGPRSWWDS